MVWATFFITQPAETPHAQSKTKHPTQTQFSTPSTTPSATNGNPEASTAATSPSPSRCTPQSHSNPARFENSGSRFERSSPEKRGKIRSMPVHDWKVALNQFSMLFEDRMLV
jgi:hypothetical protein